MLNRLENIFKELIIQKCHNLYTFEKLSRKIFENYTLIQNLL